MNGRRDRGRKEEPGMDIDTEKIERNLGEKNKRRRISIIGTIIITRKRRRKKKKKEERKKKEEKGRRGKEDLWTKKSANSDSGGSVVHNQDTP